MNEILTQEQFLIQESVKYINEEWERGLDSWFNIGEHVLDTYFDGNPEKASSKAWNKEHSFYKLCNHPELKMSPRSLSNCVRITAQDGLYFTAQALAQSLPKAHKILMLPVPAEDKIETANEISDMTWRDASAWIKHKYPKPDNWLQLYDVWNFGKCAEGMGMEYPGRIPGQIVQNVLYYWTEPDALVIDPMAGGGVTIDACKLLERRCLAYDLKPFRDDIVKHDIREGYPNDIPKADLITIDPPYFKKKAKEYALPEELLTKKGFMHFAQQWVEYCNQGIAEGGVVALIISDYVDYDNSDESIFSDEYANLFDGYKRLYKISCPLSTEQYKPHLV